MVEKNEALETARRWLVEGGHEIVYEKDGHTVVGRLRPDRRCRPFSETPYDCPEVAAVVVDECTLASGYAQARVTVAIRWKQKKPGERWIAIVAPRSVCEADLLMVRGADQVVRWPFGDVYPKG